MAEPLKNFFDERVVRSIAADLRRAFPGFEEALFVAEGMAPLEQLSLTGRAEHLAECMHRHLPPDYESAARILIASLGPECQGSELAGLETLRYHPHTLFVARYGLESFETSMLAQYELTKRFSAEWSIRAFLERYPERTYQQLQRWAGDPNVHVRRLVSEGTRPRLPWAPRLRAYQKDPRPVLALLELLKDDPERYVQRSVANNLNDIGKDHPDLAVEVCRRWAQGASENRRWIIKHALRSLVKKAHRPALAVLGADQAPEVEVRGVRAAPERVPLGGEAAISFELASTGRARQDLLVDCAVHFVKANGTLKPKVFKLRRLELSPGESVRLEARVSFAKMTTRVHYPGVHRAHLLINGREHPLCSFEVVP